MWDPEPSPRTPILFEHWISEGAFSFASASQNGSTTSPPFMTEDFLTPLSPRERNFVIIPLHTPPKRENVDKVSGFHSMIRLGDGSQAHHRSPEKRFHSPGPICRICHEGDKEETLLSPCNCNGSMQLVHKTCLETWLSTSNSDHCELCMKQLPIRKVARPIWEWFSGDSASDGPQGFYADVTCVILLTPLCILSIYLCAIGAADYMKHGVWEGTGLAALSCFLFATYLVWCYITIRFHWLSIQKWRISNQVIHLVVKECRRKDQILSRVSDSSTPRGTVVMSQSWNSPPQVRVVSPNSSERQPNVPLSENAGNQPNVMDASIRGFDVPAFL